MTTQQSQSRSKHQDSGYPSYLDVLPRFGTKRNFNNPTYGTRMGITARLMNQPFMPWQQYVADVLGEVDPRTGIRVYREGYLTCMRQVGKTTFVICLKATAALDTPQPVTIQFAAQEGKSAIVKMIEHAELIKRTPLGRMLHPDAPSRNNNNPHVRWGNGSTEKPLTEKKTSGHGDTIVLGAITEAMAHKDDRYITTMEPAMNINPNAQLFVESTQGDATSLYWNAQTKELRDRYVADAGDMGRIAFFDWSFADDEDPFAQETWRRRIPSIGHTLRIEEVEHAALNATTPEKVRKFKRNFGNIANLGAGEAAVIPDDAWEASGTSEIIVGPRAFTLDVVPDRSWSSIGWAGATGTGRIVAEVLKHERSTQWVVPYFVELFARNPRAARRVYVAASPGGQAALMADAFERAGIALIVLPRAEYAAACASYYDGITATDDEDHPQPTVFHRASGQTYLDIAIGGATWTKGTAPRIWDSIGSTSVISPLVAATLAPWAFQLEQEREQEYDVMDSIA